MEISNDAKNRLDNRVARIVNDIDVYDNDRKEILRELTSHFYDASLTRAQARGSKTIEKEDVEAVVADSEDPKEIAHEYMRTYTNSLRRAGVAHRTIALAIDFVLFSVSLASVCALIGLVLYLVLPGQIVFHTQAQPVTGPVTVMVFGMLKDSVTGVAFGSYDIYGVMAKTGTMASYYYAVLGTLGLIAVTITYLFVLEGRFGCTPGKWLLGLRVLRENGTRTGYTEAIVRNLIVLTLVFTGLIILEPLFILGLFRKTSQSACDKLAGTIVVRKNTATNHTTKEVN